MTSFFLLDESSIGRCPHQGLISFSSKNNKLFVNRKPLVTLSDEFKITGCIFHIGSTHHPCTSVKWLNHSNKISVNGNPVLTKENSGLCIANDQAPQGNAIITTTQNAVTGR